VLLNAGPSGEVQADAEEARHMSVKTHRFRLPIDEIPVDQVNTAETGWVDIRSSGS
jgi:hypothetical protein